MAEEVLAASKTVASAGSAKSLRRLPSVLPWWGLFLAFLFAAAAVISRKPELVFNAQFWGDEAIWFADAYQNGALHSILQPQAGYLCVASKVPVLFALHVPLVYAPVVFGLCTAGVHALMAVFLLTTRLASVANLQSRTLVFFLWIILPNVGEIDSLNNTQWMLAALGMTILLSSPSTTVLWKILDLLSTSIISLTGPFCILLLPLGVVWWILRRNKWSLILTCVLCAGSCMQLLVLSRSLSTCQPREMFNALLVRLTAGQIFLFGTLNGGNILPHATLTTPGVTTLAALFVIAGVTVVIYAMVSSPLELKFFIAFAALVFAAAVRRLHCDSGWDWASMMTTGYAIRYWYVPRLAALAILVWMIERRQPIWIRALAGAAILLVTASSFRHWQYQPWPYQDFRRNARSFERATKGTQISIPVNPPGWKIILIKH
jgi:hypothetical protein